MLDDILSKIRRIIPRRIFVFFQPSYHWFLAWAAAVWYWFPSRKLYVIGVTGTNGKSTVVDLLHAICSEAGEAAASASSIRFKIKNTEELNTLKMTMPGRFHMQKFLSDAARAGCKYAILEVTSEGIKQFRHRGIRFSLAVLTNVTPEHIESHGGFETYRREKAKLFYLTPNHIINGEDANREYFLKIPARSRIVYTKKDIPADWKPKLLGDFNRENIAAAYRAAQFLNISPDRIKSAVEKFAGVPGRLEFVQKDPFTVVVDYAHTPDALKKVYETLRGYQQLAFNGRLICVLGSAGGGRDRWKRPEMGNIAARYCDRVVITNEDPYDENPRIIIDEVAKNIQAEKILDRKEAIRHAITSAVAGDVVVITGKGAELWLAGPKGTKIPWDDREVAREVLRKLNVS